VELVEPRAMRRLRDDVAVLYTDFHGTTMDASEKTIDVRYNAIEVLRREPDGHWKLIVGDPNGRE